MKFTAILAGLLLASPVYAAPGGPSLAPADWVAHLILGCGGGGGPPWR